MLDRVTAPAAAAPAAGATATSDAMAVSVLVEAADGTLTPRGTDKMFRTGDRFRVKVLASRDAKIALYNTKYMEAMSMAKRLGDGMERQDAYRSGQYRQAVT